MTTVPNHSGAENEQQGNQEGDDPMPGDTIGNAHAGHAAEERRKRDYSRMEAEADQPMLEDSGN